MNALRILVPSLLLGLVPAQQHPDLVCTTLSAPPIAQAGQWITVNYDVANIGNWGSGNTFLDAIYINTVPSRSGATAIGTYCRDFNGYPFPFLLSGWSYSALVPAMNPPRSVQVPANLQEGYYYVGYFPNYGFSTHCNGVPWPIAESNMANNGMWVQIQITRLPDLVVDNLAADKTQAMPGEPLTITLSHRNLGGTQSAGTSWVEVVLAPSATNPSGSLPLGTTTPVVLGAYTSLPATIHTTIPQVAFGDYHVVAIVDPFHNVMESNEGNNLASIPLRIAPTASITPFGQGCASSLGPVGIATNGLPQLGNSGFELVVSNLQTLSLSGLIVGFSNSQAGGVPLPAPLPNAPGCFLLVSLDNTMLGYPPNPSQSQSFALPIPGITPLLGTSLFTQGVVIDYFANPLGIAFSAGLRLVIG